MHETNRNALILVWGRHLKSNTQISEIKNGNIPADAKMKYIYTKTLSLYSLSLCSWKLGMFWGLAAQKSTSSDCWIVIVMYTSPQSQGKSSFSVHIPKVHRVNKEKRFLSTSGAFSSQDPIPDNKMRGETWSPEKYCHVNSGRCFSNHQDPYLCLERKGRSWG